ncbi:hypothetical protein GCK32_019267, partial [Trichostrongylus colubriformis]
TSRHLPILHSSKCCIWLSVLKQAAIVSLSMVFI